MRIRNFRLEHLDALIDIQQAAAQADGTEALPAPEFEAWLLNPARDARSNAFVITDDDDELHGWGQAGTLDGLTGEVVGYTLVQFRQEAAAYHFLCQGAVHPAYRRQRAGRTLLMGAMNRARLLSAEFEFEAEQDQLPIYFEALLPVRDPAAVHLAAKCEMQATTEAAPDGMQLYRREL